MITHISSNMIIMPKNVDLPEVRYLPRRKHILLIPDYFTSAESFANEELRKRLQLYCGDTAVFYAEEEIVRAREEVENTCKNGLRLDLIVTVGAGCLLAAGVADLPRVFIDPEWLVSEAMPYWHGEEETRMYSRGDNISIPMHYHYKLDAQEIDAAIRMAEPDSVKTGDRPALGWFTDMGKMACNPEEQLNRFGTVYYPEGIALDSGEGLDKICQEINNLLSSLE